MIEIIVGILCIAVIGLAIALYQTRYHLIALQEMVLDRGDIFDAHLKDYHGLKRKWLARELVPKNL